MSVIHISDLGEGVSARAPWGHLESIPLPDPEREARVALYARRAAAGLDLWTGRPVAGLPRKERPPTAMDVLLRRLMATTRKLKGEEREAADV